MSCVRRKTVQADHAVLAERGADKECLHDQESRPCLADQLNSLSDSAVDGNAQVKVSGKDRGQEPGNIVYGDHDIGKGHALKARGLNGQEKVIAFRDIAHQAVPVAAVDLRYG